jgi:hypothetical protein
VERLGFCARVGDLADQFVGDTLVESADEDASFRCVVQRTDDGGGFAGSGAGDNNQVAVASLEPVENRCLLRGWKPDF